MSAALAFALEIAGLLLEGVTGPVGAILAALMPVLTEAATHEGQLTAQTRLNIQETVALAIKPFVEAA